MECVVQPEHERDETEEVDENASDEDVELLLLAPKPKKLLNRRFIGIPGAIDFLRPTAEADIEELVEADSGWRL